MTGESFVQVNNPDPFAPPAGKRPWRSRWRTSTRTGSGSPWTGRRASRAESATLRADLKTQAAERVVAIPDIAMPDGAVSRLYVQEDTAEGEGA